MATVDTLYTQEIAREYESIRLLQHVTKVLRSDRMYVKSDTPARDQIAIRPRRYDFITHASNMSSSHRPSHLMSFHL